jgi:hypothetical protein
MALKFLQEFGDAVFLAVNLKSLLGEAEVSLLETRVPVPKGVTFHPTVGSPSNFFRISRNLFFVE